VPDSVVFAYQGDGDLASIGAAEIVHAAMRGERITVIFVNNAIYGMTGGQMAPTTLVGQKATTALSAGRKSIAAAASGLGDAATIPGAAYVARVALSSPGNVAKAKTAIRKAFETQLAGEGFSLVECLSTCRQTGEWARMRQCAGWKRT